MLQVKTHSIFDHKKLRSALLSATLALFAFVFTILPASSPVPTGAVTTIATLSGYAWSSNIGWISLNCANSGVCDASNYAVTEDVDGYLHGYAWSSNIGWINFDAFSTGGGYNPPRMQAGKVTGYVKAISTSGTHGWDGLISFGNDGSSPAYGVIYTNSTENGVVSTVFSGFAWGGDVIGWIDFSPSTGSGEDCTASPRPAWCPIIGGSNHAPSSPVISGPTVVCADGADVYSFTSTDPEGSKIRYNINQGSGDIITTEFSASGVGQTYPLSWSTPGQKDFSVSASDGQLSSGSTPYSVKVNQCVGRGGEDLSLSSPNSVSLGLQEQVTRSIGLVYSGASSIVVHVTAVSDSGTVSLNKTSWDCNLSPSQTSCSQNIIFTGQSAGNAHVTITADGGNIVQTAVVNVTTQAYYGGTFSLSCSVIGSVSEVNVNQEVLWRVVPDPVGVYSYSWTGSDGLIGTGDTVSKAYSTVGVKNVEVRVTRNSDGRIETCSSSVKVKTPSINEEI